jgi:hypothetical protein
MVHRQESAACLRDRLAVEHREDYGPNGLPVEARAPARRVACPACGPRAPGRGPGQALARDIDSPP